MYSTSQPVPASLNGGVVATGRGMDTGTIDPSQLNSPVMLAGHPPGSAAQHPVPRGVKRSRSPEQYGDPNAPHGEDEESKRKKRGRPPKIKSDGSLHGVAQNAPPPYLPQQQPMAQPVQTPQQVAHPMTHQSPAQASPPKQTPTKPTVIKALPTVRDHTTDQLNAEGDEYIPREHDEAGEKKVAAHGAPLGGREYICRTFFLPMRSEKLFMLATECARNLSYRDSYLLFNKNRSLYKIIASQAEKDHLIQQDILPYSYRSRQIAIVTARSMFRQFGSRLIAHGRRVRDDYWEAKARKQGFTEEDAAGEKRPGAAKKREAAAAEAQQNTHALTALPHGEIIYSSGPTTLDGHPAVPGAAPSSLAPLPKINPAPTDLSHQRDYGNIPRPRQEIAGAAYQDRSQPSSTTEILSHAAQTAEFNRTLTQQRNTGRQYINDHWARPHESANAQQPAATAGAGDQLALQNQHVNSPSMGAANKSMGAASQQTAMPAHSQTQMMSHQGYAHQTPAQSAMAQSPLRPVHQQLRPEQMNQRASNIGATSSAPHGQTPPPYNYGQQPHMWQQQQQQQHQQQQHQPQHQQQQQHQQHSSLPQTHHSLPQYGQHPQHQQHQQQQHHGQQQHAQQASHGQQQQQQPQQHHASPHAQQSPLHASQQLHHSAAGQPMGYQGMAGMAGSGGYSRAMYQQQHAAPQQYMHQSSQAQQPGMQGWAPQPGQPGAGQQQWQF